MIELKQKNLNFTKQFFTVVLIYQNFLFIVLFIASGKNELCKDAFLNFVCFKNILIITLQNSPLHITPPRQ